MRGTCADWEPQAVGLELVKIILLTIPYAFASTATGLETRVQELLERTSIIAESQHNLQTLVEPYPGENEEKPFGFQSVIGLLQRQLQREGENGWAFALIPRLYEKVKAEGDENGDAISSVTKHPFPAISIPSPVNPGPNPLFPETFYSLYADQDIEVSQ